MLSLYITNTLASLRHHTIDQLFTCSPFLTSLCYVLNIYLLSIFKNHTVGKQYHDIITHMLIKITCSMWTMILSFKKYMIIYDEALYTRLNIRSLILYLGLHWMQQPTYNLKLPVKFGGSVDVHSQHL